MGLHSRMAKSLRVEPLTAKTWSDLDRLLAVDPHPAWSSRCFFLGRRYGRQRSMARLLQAAIRATSTRTGQALDGYSEEPLGERSSDLSACTGLVYAFLEAGFEEIERRSDGRPHFRYRIGG